MPSVASMIRLWDQMTKARSSGFQVGSEVALFLCPFDDAYAEVVDAGLLAGQTGVLRVAGSRRSR